MGFSLSSFIASSIAISVLIVILNFIISKTSILLKYGISCIYGFILLILLRGYLPYDFYSINLTTSFYSYNFIPMLKNILSYRLLYIGSYSITLEYCLLAPWTIGSIIFILKRIYGYITFRKKLCEFTFVQEDKIIKIYTQVFTSLFPHRKSKCQILREDIFSTPAILGFINPIIILPHISYDDNELRFIFLHELLHYKHKDFLLKSASDLLAAIHWWNPLIRRFLFSSINQVQELFVDYTISKSLNESEKLAYLNVLSKSVKHACHCKSGRRQIYALADNHSSPNMMQRLYCIINSSTRRISFWGILLSIFMFVLSFTFVFEPSYKPEYDELGNRVFYGDKSNSYYIKNGTSYDLYLDDNYVYTSLEILENFKKFPIYNNLEELK